MGPGQKAPPHRRTSDRPCPSEAAAQGGGLRELCCRMLPRMPAESPRRGSRRAPHALGGTGGVDLVYRSGDQSTGAPDDGTRLGEAGVLSWGAPAR